MPSFGWGGRIGSAPPNFPFPGYLNINRSQDLSISLTKVFSRHTLKTGFYNTHSFKAQQRQGWAGTINFGNDANNPLDSGFGFANAALGVFSSYNQFSRYVEGSFIYDNTEAYVQDNWKVSSRLTLDYGVRFVRQQPQYDKFGQAANFLPEKWTGAQAPLLYLPGCAGASPCTGANRQARDPRTRPPQFGTRNTRSEWARTPSSRFRTRVHPILLLSWNIIGRSETLPLCDCSFRPWAS